METVHITAKGRDELILLKRYTGIQQWNILCRWALATSLSEASEPGKMYGQGAAELSIDWRVFGGREADLYWALVQQRCRKDGIGESEETVAEQFRRHLHRGISYLAADKSLRSIPDLVRRAL